MSQPAPGWPGAPPRWTSSRKAAVGTARSPLSKVWFTIARGILTEIYYPRLDRTCVRDMQLLVADGAGFFAEEKTDTDSRTEWQEEGVPAFRVTNTCTHGRFVIEKTIITDPVRQVLLQKISFQALVGRTSDYHVYVLLAPHFANRGQGNNARVGDYKGVPMLLADSRGLALALAASVPWRHRSAGFVGVSDGWQDVHAHHAMLWEYEEALDGNVALTGELDLSSGSDLVLALGFGHTANEAGHRARVSLQHGFGTAYEAYVEGWRRWQGPPDDSPSSKKHGSSVHRTSLAVLGTHESKSFQGGMIGSLCIPWGESHGDQDVGGYHLVWPRDACESAGALLAAGHADEVVRALHFLAATQEHDGHWPQNMWMDGTGFWTGTQLDEVAGPVLLLDLARRSGCVDDALLRCLWPMARAAAAFLLRQGPSSPQDRWEEDAGLTPATLAATIAALLAVADFAELQREPALAAYLRETADAWNEAVESWLYVRHGALGRRLGVDGYYVRLVPAARLSLRNPIRAERIVVPNHPAHQDSFPADEIVSPDALALVRYGLRAADDPRIVNTVRVIDAELKVETPMGPCWHRYSHDGYGEHADGQPFDGHGVGRGWPLLTAERAHYELAAGRLDEARHLLDVLESLADDEGLIPEQVWDGPAIPERNLYPGRSTGSAQPLVWAHAEYVKLLRSLRDGKVFDQPPQTVARYLRGARPARHAPWRFAAAVAAIRRERELRVEALAPFRLRWTTDDWQSTHEADAHDLDIGLYHVDLPTEAYPTGTRVEFTFYWPQSERWEGRNLEVVIVDESD